MTATRREFIAVTGTAVAATTSGCASAIGAGAMYGLIGKMKAAPGHRDELAAILLDATAEMPGCRSYIIANAPDDPDALWITEVWDSKEFHSASLELPSVRAAIARARPIIAGFGERYETEPIGGHGLR